MKRKAWSGMALVGLLFASQAGAQALQKCTGPDGSVSYTNQGCPSAAKAAPVRVSDNTADMRQDLVMAERIKREQAAEAARLRAQAAIGMQAATNAKPGARRADAANEEAPAAGASGKECNDAMPRGLDAKEKSEFIAACMAGKPIAPRPPRIHVNAPEAPRTLNCTGRNGNLHCF
jgi:hypothetical protein